MDVVWGRGVIRAIVLILALTLLPLQGEAFPRGGKHGVQAIVSITPSSCSFTAGITNGAVCSLSVTMSPASPSFSGTLALCTGTNTPVTGCSGVNSGGFHLSGSTIEQSSGGTAIGVYSDVTAYATQGTTIFQPLTLTGSAAIAGSEEFVGPFASWKNAKTDYGAAGNGTTNDTTALQSGLNGLTSTNPILFLPCGTYKITSSLTLFGQLNVGIVGEDPACVTILWAGSSGGTMFSFHNTTNSKVDRITWNGAGSAAIIIDHDWDGSTNYFPTLDEFADDVFENSTSTAFLCGATAGCSEVTILRDTFSNNNVGVTAYNQNALNVWVWYSTFVNNTKGITNAGGAFHVFESKFQNSSAEDIAYGNLSAFTIRNNWSSGSAQFICCGDSNGSQIALVQGNTILNTTNSVSIEENDLGPLVLIDNTILSHGGAAAPIVKMRQGRPFNELFSMGNTFTISGSFCGGLLSLDGSPSICHSIGDAVVSSGSIDTTPPTLPGTPPNLGRTIYEASPSGSGTTCSVGSPCSPQQAITKAAVGCTNNVAHIQPGTYSIATTITVPASCQVQVIGDGEVSALNGGGASPVLQLLGPSLATLRDLHSTATSISADIIEVDAVDASGSGGRVFMSGVVPGNSVANIFVDGIDYAQMEAHNLYETGRSGATASVVIAGGGAHGASFNSYLEESSGAANTAYNSSGAAQVNTQGVWNESGVMVALTGPGKFSMAASEVTTPFSPLTQVAAVTGFTGAASFVSLTQLSDCVANGHCGTYGNFNISGSGSGGKVLGLGLAGSSTTFWFDTTSPADTNEFLIGQKWSDVSGPLSEIGAADPTFLANTLSLMRTNQPTVPAALSAGQTDVRMYRVSAGSGRYGIHLLP